MLTVALFIALSSTSYQLADRYQVESTMLKNKLIVAATLLVGQVSVAEQAIHTKRQDGPGYKVSTSHIGEDQ